METIARRAEEYQGGERDEWERGDMRANGVELVTGAAADHDWEPRQLTRNSQKIQ